MVVILLMNFMYLKKSLIPVNLGYAILTPTRNIDFKFMCRISKLNVIQLLIYNLVLLIPAPTRTKETCLIQSINRFLIYFTELAAHSVTVDGY